MQEELLPDISFAGKMKMNYTAHFTSKLSAAISMVWKSFLC